MKFNREIIPFCKCIEFPYLASSFVLNNEGTGNVIPIPFPVISGKIYFPTRYLKAVIAFYKWKGVRLGNFNDNDIVYIPKPFNMKMFFHWFELLATEIKDWKKYYIPPYSLKGKTILDAGAGCGETAWLYFKYGAKKVICIEPNPNRFKLIEENARINNWNVELINDYLHSEDLTSNKFDFAKIDIEGSEFQFLDELSKIPCVVETHTILYPKLYRSPNHDDYKYFKDRGFITLLDNHRGVRLVTSQIHP